MMMRRLTAVLAALAISTAACGDDDDTAIDDDVAVDVDDDDDGAVDGDGGASVTIVDFSFEPDTVEVAADGEVTWTNEDGVTHTVTAGTPGSPTGDFDESLDPGATVDLTFDEAGTVDYFCSIHPRMTGQVVVS